MKILSVQTFTHLREEGIAEVGELLRHFLFVFRAVVFFNPSIPRSGLGDTT